MRSICGVVALGALGLGLGLDPELVASMREPAAIISGRLQLDVAGDRTPLRRAKMTLTAEGDHNTRTLFTGTEGEFQFAGLEAGRYFLEAAKAGFVANVPRTVIDVKPFDTVTLSLLMQRGGAIEGRFLNYLRQPITQLTIVAEPMVSAEGSRSGASQGSAATDDLGRFRVHSLRPGKYRLHSPGTGWFYPGTFNPDEATILTVASGETLGHFDLVVPRTSSTASSLEARRVPDSEPRREVVPGFTGMVAGRVTRVDTGEPLANINVVLNPSPTRDEIVDQKVELLARRPLTVPTDDDGRFVFSEVAAGNYALIVRAVGFVAVGGPPSRLGTANISITLKDGERRERVNVGFAPTGSIEGRLVDEYGDPAPGIIVVVSQLAQVAGKPRLMPATGVVTAGPTDDRGWFRLSGLPPGNCYLAAMPEPFERSGAGFAPTFFPGTALVDAASPVHIPSDGSAVDVRFGLIAARTSTVSGVATDTSGRPVPKAQVRLMPTYGHELRMPVMVSMTADGEGVFVVRDVPDGTYVIHAEDRRMFGHTTMTVAGVPGVDPAPMVVVMKPRVTARGRVVFEGTGTRTTKGLGIGFQPSDFVSGPAGGLAILSEINPSAINPNWNFEIPNLAWHGMLRVIPPSGWALAQVRVNGTDITDKPYDFQSADVSGIEVVLTSRIGTVSGTVAGSVQSFPEATVLIFGADDVTWPYLVRTLRVAQPDQQGAFRVQGLVAGRYFAVALSKRIDLQDSSVLLGLRTSATRVVVTEGADTVVGLLRLQ